MERITARGVWRNVALAALFTALAVGVLYPALEHISWWGVHDWSQFYTYFGVPRRAIVEYQEMPGWNPYFYGGNVQWGHPDDATLSPIFLPILLWGEVIGAKINILMVLVGGMFSMWFLARRLKLSATAALFAAAVWGLNGWHAYHFAVGHCDHLTFLFQPLAVLFFLKSMDDLRWSIALGAVTALMFLSGGPYPFVFTLELAGVLALLFAGQRNSFRPLAAYGLGVLFTLGFAAVKLLASAQFMLYSVPGKPDISGTGLAVLWRALFDPSLPMYGSYAWTGYGAWEYGAFIGYLPAALFAVGAVVTARRTWPWLAMGAIFLVASFGAASPLNLFSVLTGAPGLWGMHVPFRFVIHFILAAALVGGMGLDWICERARRTRLKAAALGLAVALTAVAAGDLVRMHYDRPVPLYRLASYFVPGEAYGGPKEFAPVAPLSSEARRYVPLTYAQPLALYTAFLDGRRLSWGYDAVHLKEAAHFPGQEGYRGEAYIEPAGAGNAEIVGQSLSEFTVKYDSAAPGTLVLNQNYHPAWRVNGAAGGAFNEEGLVAVEVDEGSGEVTFVYRPVARVIGAAMTLLAIAGAVVFARRRRTGATAASSEGL